MIILCLYSKHCLFSACPLPANVLFHRTCLRLSIQPLTPIALVSILPCLVWISSTSWFSSLSSLNVTCLEAVFFRIGSATFGAVVGVVWNYSHRLFANHVWHFVRNAPGKATGPKSSKSWDDLTIGPLNITFKSFGRWCVSWANVALCSLAVILQSFNTSRSLRKIVVQCFFFSFWEAVLGGIVCCEDCYDWFLLNSTFWKSCFLQSILDISSTRAVCNWTTAPK